MRLRPYPFARALLLALALMSLGGCKVLGMRNIPLTMLEDDYEKPNSRYMEIDGVRMHYTVDGKGPPVLLLHGVLASLHTWDGWVPLLKDNFTVIRVDIPGFGLSESFKDDSLYTPEYAAEFVEKARKKLGVEKMHIVGNSLGGFIAWYYSVKYPQHVEKLVLIDPASYPQKLPFIIGFAANSVIGLAAQLSTPRFIVKRNVRKVYGNPDNVTDETIDRYHALLLRQGHRHSLVQYCRVLRKYAKTEELVQHIPEIKAKTLLMWGEKDRWVPPKLIERWQHDLPDIEVKTYPEGGHIPMEEFPEETARDAFAFLADGAEMEEPGEAAPAPKAAAKAKPPTDEDDEETSGDESAGDEHEEAPTAPPAKSASPKIDPSIFDDAEE
ncbi:MAG: alpha/beta hydrolase [Myxococcaceae bacterium]|nr:alpha/beta hydrolase [Myxococcaceae bacterium]